MIEGLCEYLVRHGWDEDVADEIQDACHEGGMNAVAEAAEGYGEDELVQVVKNWMAEAGEI